MEQEHTKQNIVRVESLTILIKLLKVTAINIFVCLAERLFLVNTKAFADVKLHCVRDSQIIMNTHDKNNAKAEAKVVNFLVQHNLPLAAADHLGSYLRTYFLTVRLFHLMFMEELRHLLSSIKH